MYAILIPALNEGLKIGTLVEQSVRLTEYVVVVDDGSTDNTARIAKSAGAFVLKNETNQGLGFALNRGLRFLFNRGVDNVVTIDGDGAHDPSLIPELVSFHLNAGADITIGSRLLVKPNDSFPSPKRSSNLLGALILQHFCNVNLSDIASGMRVISSKYLQLPQFSMGYGFSFELLCAAARNGMTLRDYPIHIRYDAREFFATRSSEIIGLMKAADLFSIDEQFKNKLDIIINKLNNYEQVVVGIKNYIFYLFPIREYGAYLCQEQNSVFHNLSKEVLVLL